MPEGQANIAGGTFKDKAAKCYSALDSGIADALTNALPNTRMFAVHERENTAELTQEAFFGGGTAFQGADMLIFGSITQYEPEGSSGEISFLGISLGQESSIVGLDLRAVDAKTRRVVGAVQVQGKAEGNSPKQKPGSRQLNTSAFAWGTLSLPCHNHTQIRAHKGEGGRMEQR